MSNTNLDEFITYVMKDGTTIAMKNLPNFWFDPKEEPNKVNNWHMNFDNKQAKEILDMEDRLIKELEDLI